MQRTVIVVLVGLTAACATIPYRVAPAARVDLVRVRTQVAREDVSIKVLASDYGNGGGRLTTMLVGAAIDAAVESGRGRDAERRMRPLRAAIHDLDHPARLWERLVPGLQALERPRVVDVLTSREMMPVTPEDVRETAFISVATSYDLSPDASVLEMHTDYSLYLRGSTSPAAIGSVSYWSPRIGGSPDDETWKEDEEAIALWAADDAAAYRAAVDQGVAETVEMLRIALPFAIGEDVAGEPVEVQYDLTHGRGDFGIAEGRTCFRGRVVERTRERMILQVYGGPIYSLPVAEVWERRLP